MAASFATPDDDGNVVVILMDMDGKIEHARGSLPYDLIQDYQALSRNGHTYVIDKMVDGKAVFTECLTPYMILEF